MAQVKKLRVLYFIAAVFVFLTEFLIAVYLKEGFVRNYIGDLLVVVLIYALIRIFMPVRCRLLPLYIFLFALATELLQYFKIADILGLKEGSVLRIIIGTSFDFRDIICYGIGCGLLGAWEYFYYGRKK